jgi:polyisoprenoid-binding protein YceI
MTSHFTTAGVLALLCAAGLGAQSPSAVRLQLAPGSQLSFDGTSTLHGFTCTTSKMQAYIDVDRTYQTVDLSTLAHPIVGVDVVIPVSSLACGGELESNMRKTLNAEKYPYIIYKLSNYDIVSGSASASGFTASTHGQLTIAGKDNPVNMTVQASRSPDGVATASGDYTLHLADFGIKPPTFFLGTLRVGGDVKLKFTINATSGSVASAISELRERAIIGAANDAIAAITR